MNLDEYAKENGAVALSKSLGCSLQFFYQLKKGLRAISPHRAVLIERATGGAVTRKDLRPHDWREIWPELAEKGE